MNTKYIISAVVIIAVILGAAFIYVYYQGQTSAQLETLHNLIDDTGYKTSLDAIPNRIISMAPSTTEIVFALGLDDKVVGVSNYCDYPYNFSAWIAAGNMTSIGDFSNPNMEVIASLEPDLIIATGGVQGPTIATLRDLGYKVLVLNPANISGVLQNIELVGNATGKTSEAKALNDNIESRINSVVNKVASATSKPKVYYEVWYDPTSLWTAGGKAWQNELIEKAGGVNIFADQNLEYFQSSSEAVISRNPDVILLPEEGMGKGEPFWVSLDAVKARPGWSSISAVQNNRLVTVDSNTIARAGPRVADIIEDLAKAFHPELF
ncbi:cobalamin-binding protein [Candidatus Bathyarchaeota archaeon A05DMB-2]|nr:cobalamin-binding protein [Candidatus Bathyarchaeota archaeon A05DMB-2]